MMIERFLRPAKEKKSRSLDRVDSRPFHGSRSCLDPIHTSPFHISIISLSPTPFFYVHVFFLVKAGDVVLRIHVKGFPNTSQTQQYPYKS